MFATNLLRELQHRGHEIIVVTRQDSLDLPLEDHYRGIPIYRFPFWTAFASRSVDQLSAARRALAKLKRDFAPDLVHIHGFGPSVLFQLDTARAHPCPLLVTLIGERPHGERRELLGRMLGAADWVTCVSNAVFAHWCQVAPEISAYSSVVYNGLVPPSLSLEPLPTDPPRLLCVGRLHPDKCFDLALKAFALVIDRFPGARLIIAGDGVERPLLERQVADMGLENVEFVGWVTPGKIFALMNAATVVVMPSRYESFGLVALEAALMARPVVATRVGGLPEVVLDGQTGLLVESEDFRALAAAIISLLQRPERANQMGQMARCRAIENFNWDHCVNAYDTLYRRLIGGNDATCPV